MAIERFLSQVPKIATTDWYVNEKKHILLVNHNWSISQVGEYLDYSQVGDISSLVL